MVRVQIVRMNFQTLSRVDLLQVSRMEAVLWLEKEF